MEEKKKNPPSSITKRSMELCRFASTFHPNNRYIHTLQRNRRMINFPLNIIDPLIFPTRCNLSRPPFRTCFPRLDRYRRNGGGGRWERRGFGQPSGGSKEIQSSIRFGQLNSLFRSKLYVVYTYEFNRRYGVLIWNHPLPLYSELKIQSIYTDPRLRLADYVHDCVR